MSKRIIIDKIREIDELDKPVGRYDLIPLFNDNYIFGEMIDILSEPYLGKIDYVVSPEALGWILGTAISRKLGVGFIPLRKENKLPYSRDKIIKNTYIDNLNNKKTLEIKDIKIHKNSRILLVDEWIESGLTIKCCINLLEKMDYIIAGIATIGIDENENTIEWIEENMVTFIGKNI